MSAVDTFGQQFHPGLLLQLINSETVVFDILTEFFYHSNQAVASAALEVYIRRSYTAYELTGVHHFQLSCGSSFFTFRFILPTGFVSSSNTNNNAESSLSNGYHSDQHDPTNHNLSITNCFQSMIDMDSIPLSGERMGGMAAFKSLKNLEESFGELIRLFNSACTEAKSIHTSLSEPTFDYARQFTADVHCKSHDSESLNNAVGLGGTKLVSFQDPPYQTYLGSLQIIDTVWLFF
ncbi:unnamed protein product [Trichobilharzia regenti]|nr:unnamed protein product [Trichobilharzia regenti]